MLNFDEAIGLLATGVRSLGRETVPLEHAAGRYLAEDICARRRAPLCDVSMMDGYAVRLGDADKATPLPVRGEARPGIPFGRPLGPGEAVRIYTGAPLPKGADGVIMQEYAKRDGPSVLFEGDFGPARHVRKAGSDFQAGDRLLAAGTRLVPSTMILAAAGDRSELDVTCRPRVAIIATGDELRHPGEAHLEPHAVPESASFGVAALCANRGGEVVLRLRGSDDLGELSALARRAVEEADCVVVIGGASVGDHDLARPMFTEIGMDLVFSKVAIRPGKPVWLGMAGGKPVLGLPGNPTSAMVTARLFLAPLLALLQGGLAERELAFVPIPCAASLPGTDRRETFLRAHVTDGGLMPAGNQASGAQAPLGSSNWLIRRGPEAPPLEAGAIVSALSF